MRRTARTTPHTPRTNRIVPAPTTLDTPFESDNFEIMKGKTFSLFVSLFLLLVVASPVLAADSSESVFLPGWFAWLMVLIALAVPLALFLYLKSNGRL